MTKAESRVFLNTAFGDKHVESFMINGPSYNIEKAEAILQITYSLYLDEIYSIPSVKQEFLNGRKHLNQSILAYLLYMRGEHEW